MKSARTVALKLIELYGDKPGVIKIQEDGTPGGSILIFFDRNKLRTIFPSKYDGINIIMYDVRQVLVMSYHMVELMKKKLDLSVIENQQHFHAFHRSMEICHELLL